MEGQAYNQDSQLVDDDPALRPRNLRIQSVNENVLDPELKQKLEILL